MKRELFLRTDRLAFSRWQQNDVALAATLWGDPAVTKYICASGKFTTEDIKRRLAEEISNHNHFGVQYWPCFQAATGKFVGCCGLRPYKHNEYELGFHLRPEFWEKGYATEAATAVIQYAFAKLNATALFAGHNPNNKASEGVVKKLGFTYILRPNRLISSIL